MSLRYLISFCRLVLLSFFFVPSLLSQSSPQCFLLQNSTEAAQPGDTVCVSLRAYGFDDIISLQFPIEWDSSGLELLPVGPTFSTLPGFSSGSYSITPNAIKIGWTSQSGSGIDRPDGAVLFRLCFRAKQNSGFFPVFIGAGSPNYEVAKDLIQSPPVFMPFNQQTGGVHVGTSASNAGDLRFGKVCAIEGACNATNSLNVPVFGGTPPYHYAWSGPGNFSADSNFIDQIVPGTYVLTVQDAEGRSIQGSFLVKNGGSDLNIRSLAITPAFCYEKNGAIAFEVEGGVKPYQFKWSTGKTQAPPYQNLAPGNYTVTISDTRGCQRIYNFNIGNDSLVGFTLTGWTSPQSCKEKTWLKANLWNPTVGGYTYQWSNGGTTDYIENLTKGLYTITVTHPNGCSTTQSKYVDEYVLPVSATAFCPTQTFPLRGVKLVINSFNRPLQYPLEVVWNDGTARTIQRSILGGLDTLKDVPSGVYSATLTDAIGCTGIVSAALSCNSAQPATADTLPFFYVEDGFIPGTPIDTCTGVHAKNFRGLTAVSLEWGHFKNPPIDGIKIKNWTGLDLSHFEAGDSTLALRWQAPLGQPLTLPDSTLLFELCFDETSFDRPDVSEPVRFTHDRLSPEVRGRDGQELPFAGRDGYVLYWYWIPTTPPNICGIDVSKPDCAADGHASVRFATCNGSDPYGAVYRDRTYYGPLQNLLFAESGYYQINQPYDNDPSRTVVMLKVPYETDTTQSCVWPGDADNNNATNHHDLLAIGIGYGANGPVRPDASLNWVGQYSPAWAQATPNLNINYRNIDTDGNGTINAADTFAIALNWGSVINPNRDDPYAAPGGGLVPHNAPPLRLPSDTLFPSESVQLPLSFGTPDMPLDSFYGLAFSISYDPAFLKPGVRFSPRASWMGKPEELLWMQRDFHEQGRLDIAITRTDGKPVKGGGYIGEMFVVIEDNIFGLKAANNTSISDAQIDSIKTTTLYFGNPQCISASGATGPVRCDHAQLVIKRKTTVVVNDPAEIALLTLRPNPATNHLQIHSPAAVLQRLEIMDWRGVLIMAQNLSGNQAQCSVTALPPGGYVARVYTEAGVAVRKVVVNR